MNVGIVGETAKSEIGRSPAFFCQKCSQPLKLDQSLLSNFDELFISDITGACALFLRKTRKYPAEPFVEDSNAPVHALLAEEVTPVTAILDADASVRTVQAASLPTSSSADFMLLGDLDHSSLDLFGKRLKVAGHLFDILSGQAEVDHPLCEECTDTLLTTLDQQYRITEDECRDYKDFLETLQKQESVVLAGEGNDCEDLDKQLLELQAEEQRLLQELTDVDSSNIELERALVEAKDMEQALKNKHAEQLREYNEYKQQIVELEDAHRSIDNQMRYAEAQLEKLKKTNAFNATFHIWHSGPFGTINGFRLGRLPNNPVDWSEINAAWGQAVLLLNALVNKTNMQFQRYRLVPFGSHSYIEALNDASKELPLHCAGGIRFFWDTKFDHAMVAFLDCLQQFQEHVERGDTGGFSLPYRMSNGKIEDSNTGSCYSIKIQFNSEEQWTKALKFMLTNLKWGLAWVSAQFAASKE